MGPVPPVKLPHSWHRSARQRPQEPLLSADPGALRETAWRDMAVRFAFGATISVAAGVIGLYLGPRPAGLFLAFPAILPATLTLIAKDDSERSAVHDDDGALLGGVGLVAFGAVAWWLLPRQGAAVALPVAAAAWLVTSVLLYLLSRLLIGEPKPRRS
jgi:hypothetical protein